MSAEPVSDRSREQSTGSNSGLGRGLSGILGDVAGHAPTEGVSALLGSSARRNSPEVRRIVAELAVDTMSAGFAADGVLMARLGPTGTVDPLQTRLANAWAPGDPLGFEINGRLWNCLTERTSVQGQVAVGRLHVLLARHKIGPVVVATAVVRSRPFDQGEQEQLAGLLRSAARATEVDVPLPEGCELQVHLEHPHGERVAASIELVVAGNRRTGQGTGTSDELATAEAVIDLLGIDLGVRFAGSTIVDRDHVTIVVLERQAGPVFGLAVTGSDITSGTVEATLSAVVAAGVDPFETPATT